MHFSTRPFNRLVTRALVFLQVSSLKGKVALVTGASSGIGAGTSVLFARLGALLALNGRDVENLQKVAQQCRDCGAAEVPTP